MFNQSYLIAILPEAVEVAAGEALFVGLIYSKFMLCGIKTFHRAWGVCLISANSAFLLFLITAMATPAPTTTRARIAATTMMPMVSPLRPASPTRDCVLLLLLSEATSGPMRHTLLLPLTSSTEMATCLWQQVAV